MPFPYRPRWIAVAVAALAVLTAVAARPVPSSRDDLEEPGESNAWNGCGCGHACGAGCGCGAFTCSSGSQRYGGLTRDDATLAALAAIEGLSPCVDGWAAQTFPCRGIDLAGYVPLAALRDGATSASNLWGFRSLDDGREYAVIGLDNGTSVVDVSDPARPVVVGSVAGLVSRWREVKTYQVHDAAAGRHRTYAYVVSEAPGAGLQILDLSDLPRSVSLAATDRQLSTAHTVSLSNVDLATMARDRSGLPPVLYVQGFDRFRGFEQAGILALDLSTPVAPVRLGAYQGSYGHDVWAGVVRGGRAAAACSGRDPCEIVVSWGGDAIRILDFTDKSRPAVLSRLVYPELGYAHSGWISRDGLHLFSMDELDERAFGVRSRVRVVDIRDLAAPRLAAVWESETAAIEHNGYTVGSRFYFSHYEHGLTVLDVSDPEAPRERAFFDTYPAGENPEFHGAWGVYPFLPSGTLLVSNIDGAGGLFLLKESAAAENPRGTLLPASPRVRLPRLVQ